MNTVGAVIIGIVVGAAIVLAVTLLRRGRDVRLARGILDESQKTREQELAAIIDHLKVVFATQSREALSANTDDFLKLARERLAQQTVEGEKSLEGKKKLIDARLEEIGAKLGDLNRIVQSAEKQRAESFGSLKTHIERSTQVTNRLSDTTAQLREALANPQRRGQWGERMAEDVLRLAGFIEGVNYVKQTQIADGTRPDFSFMLPDHRLVHMDVKFPLANYLKMLDADDDAARKALAGQFLKDVRARIKEVTGRSYIDPAEGTVDYVLVFIPNEQVYGFIHEQDSSLLDDALRSKVVLCSPMTLYAILAVIRQVADNFHLEQGAKQILALLAEFKKQWGKYTVEMDRLGDRLESATKSYDEVMGVRTRQLDRQLDKIDDIRDAHAQHAALPSDANALPSDESALSAE